MGKACLKLSLLLLLSAAVAWSQKAAPPEHAGSSYVGSDTCQPCHDDIYRTVSDSAHLALLENEHPGQKGCESCHGPGSAHVNGNGDASKVFRFGESSVEVVRARCGQCHQNFMGQDAGHQKLSCLACHSAHHYQQKKFLLSLGKEQLCQRCH